jgi:tRNA U34 5-methylaminomethyl-2-thiouridine-forming methyltransferase MnmC
LAVNQIGRKTVSIYIRFENQKQVETTTLESKPTGNDWYEAPENFEWQKSYYLTEGGEIVERTKEDIQKELLDNAKLCAFDNIRTHFNNFTSRFSGHSHQKAKSYEIQAKTAENILTAPESIDEKDAEIIEPLAKVRGITVIEVARIIEEKVKKAVKAIIKCEELEDLAKRKIEEAKSENELEDLLNDFKQKMQRNG